METSENYSDNMGGSCFHWRTCHSTYTLPHSSHSLDIGSNFAVTSRFLQRVNAFLSPVRETYENRRSRTLNNGKAATVEAGSRWNFNGRDVHILPFELIILYASSK